MDRLSELPDAVIFHVFWSLPMTDVVKTTILSKRWKDLWTTTPFLNFIDHDFTAIEKHRNSVNRALLRWNGVRILKFKVKSFDNVSIYGDTYLWVHFAKKHEVEELYLDMMDFRYVHWRGAASDDKSFWVPQCLYSCSSLKKLSIQGCYLSINGNVEWNQLKSLTIIDGFEISEHDFNHILSGSPQLEVLILSFVESGESLCVRSTSLKVLSIYKYMHHSKDPSLCTELRIWAPNLETLEVKGNPYRKCLLMNVSSLTHITLGLLGLHHFGETFCFYSKIHYFSSTDHFLGELFSQVLPSIQHVGNVTLMSCCVKVLGAMMEKCMNSSSPNVKSLQLRYLFNDKKQFVGIIEICPQLKKLVLKVGKWDTYHDGRAGINFDDKCYIKFEANIPKSFVMQLKRVEVTWFEGDNLFPFLEYLLKYASKLEKMVFRVKGVMPPSRTSESLLLASQKLLRMPRSSPTAKFIFCEY